MTLLQLSPICSANADSASLTPYVSGSFPHSAAATQTTDAPLYLALAPAAGGVALVDISPQREDLSADKRSELLALIGSWAGDDFEACLGLAYETRSTVETGHVPS